MLKKTQLLTYASMLILAGCGDENIKLPNELVAQKVSAPLQQVTPFSKSSDNKLCLAEFQSDRDTCLDDFRGRERALCMQAATAEKKQCLAGETELIIANIEMKPADINSYSLADFGIEAGSIIVAGEGDLDIGTPEYLIVDGQLFVGSPGDTGQDQSFTLSLEDANGQTSQVNLIVKSTRPTEIVTQNDSPGEPDDTFVEQNIPLLISGLGPLNSLGAADLVFSANIDKAISPENSTIAITTDDFTTIDISDRFDFDPVSNQFTLLSEDLAALLDIFPTGSFEVSINIVSEDFEFAEEYVFTSLIPLASVTGQIVGANASPLSGVDIDNLKVAIVGADSQTRQVVSVDANGQFEFSRLVSEGYEFTIIDLNYPDFFTGYVGVFGNTTDVNITIPYTPEIFDGGSAVSVSKQNAGVVGSKINNANSQNGVAPIRTSKNKNSIENGVPVFKLDSSVEGCGVDSDGDTYYTTTSAAEGVAQSCAVNYTAEEGVTGIEIEVEVQSDEYPDYTTEQSEFDDRWKYSFAAKNNDTTAGSSFFQEGGRVNQTHATRGSITAVNACVQVKVPAEGETLEPIKIVGTISATNIGDSAFPTKVSVKISEGCGNLLIEEATLSTPNSKSYDIFSPLSSSQTGNLDGRYIAIPTTAPDGAEVGVPLKVKYSPKDAEISEATLSVVRNGNVVGTTANIMSGVTASDGVIDFKNLVIPTLSSVSSSNDRISLSVQLKGTVSGEDSSTELGIINVDYDDENSFRPLYLAENEISGRRYGQGGAEEGDDNWARKSTINWLKDNTFIYNDISAQHVAQKTLPNNASCPLSGKGSILCHKTHSDGLAVDLRYVSPAGTFPNGGLTSENLAMVSAALTEKNANNGTTVKQEVLANWVKGNRTAIANSVSQARKIYVANGTLGKALINGEYSDGTDILDLPFTPPPPPPEMPEAPVPSAPAIGKWTKPSIVKSLGGHSNHWHIALKE